MACEQTCVATSRSAEFQSVLGEGTLNNVQRLWPQAVQRCQIRARNPRKSLQR